MSFEMYVFKNSMAFNSRGDHNYHRSFCMVFNGFYQYFDSPFTTNPFRSNLILLDFLNRRRCICFGQFPNSRFFRDFKWCDDSQLLSKYFRLLSGLRTHKNRSVYKLRKPNFFSST